MSTPAGEHTYREIRSQGEVWAATLEDAAAQIQPITEWLRQQRAEVVFTGCGSTHYLSLTAATIWQTLTQTPARGLPASELWLFPESQRPHTPSLLVAVSRSGETTETLRAVESYRRQGVNDTLAITCYADRLLVDQVAHSLIAHSAHEQSLAQTRSFSSMLLLILVAAATASARDDLRAELQRLPALADRLMTTYAALARRLGSDQGIEQFVFLGSGPYYGLACEAMLKMKEMSLSTASAFHTLEFRHGPKSMVGPQTLIVGLVSDTARVQERAVLAEMQQLGARILAIAEDGAGIGADEIVSLESGVSELGRSPLLLPILQLLAYERAMSKNLNPDQPTNLDAVVRL